MTTEKTIITMGRRIGKTEAQRQFFKAMDPCTWRLIHRTPIRPNNTTALHHYRLGCNGALTHWRPPTWQYCPACGRPLAFNDAPETSDE